MELPLPQRKDEAASRLIVEFAVSNHNVLKQQRDRKRAVKTSELSVTQNRGEKREFFDISSKDKSKVRMRFGTKRSGKIRGDYDKEKKKPNTSNKHMAKRLRNMI